MSRFENRLPPENINVSKNNLLLEFVWLLAGVALSVIALVGVVYVAGSLLARHIPLSWENRIADALYPRAMPEDARSLTLQKLADRLAKGLILPQEMRFRLTYVDDNEVNAYASLGGHIHIHRGLITRLNSENALAMVIAHEMAHVLHRDVADSMGGSMAVGAAMLLLSPVIGVDGLNSLVGFVQDLTLKSFSREAEARADDTAIALVGRHYGHLGGAREVFDELAAYEKEAVLLATPELLSTHPDTLRRTNLLIELGKTLNLPLEGRLRPLPTDLIKAEK